MKKIQIILLAFITLVLGMSCENDGGTSLVSLNDGAVPNMVKSPATETFLDLIKVLNGEVVNIGFNAEVVQGNPISTDIVGIYKTLAGPVYNAVLFSNVTLPQDFTMTSNDIVAAFSELNSGLDFEVGDVLTVTTRFTMADGTVLNIVNEDGTSNTGTNIQTTVLFTSIITYPVTCPTMLEGNYTSIVVSSNIGLGNFRSPQPVTITQPAAGTYVLSDGTADIFGNFPIGLTFTDVCGVITVATPSTNFPGQVDFAQGSGTNLDPNTGIITLDLAYTATSCCGLPGIEYILQLVPN